MEKLKIVFYQLIIIFLLVFSNVAKAQGIKRNTLSAFGGSTNLGGQVLSQSVGQPANTTTSTSTNLTIRQGFQQPISKPIYNDPVNCSINVFPNPSLDGLIEIKADESFNNINKYLIHDARGALVHNALLDADKTNLNLRFLTPGLYIIVFQNDENLTCNTKLIIGNK
jgi:hypothetical protein